MKIKVFLLTFVLLLGALPLFAPIYMNIPSIPGEAKDAAHQGWIELTSFSWGAGAANAVVVQGGINAVVVQGGKFPCNAHQLNFTKHMDKASPQLAQAALSGSPIPSLTLDVNGERHMLQNVQIKSVQKQQIGGFMGEAVSMSFTRCATHDTTAPAVNAVSKGTYIKINPNASLTLSGNAPGTFTLQDLKFNGQNQAVLHCRESGGGTLAALLRAFQSKQSMPSLKIAAKASDANSQQMTFTFTNVMVSGYQSGGSSGLDQFTLNFAKVEGPPSGFVDIWIK